MHVTFTPEDGDRLEWDFDPGRMRASAAEVIERRFGENFEVWSGGVQSGSMRARRVLLWHLLTLQHATLRYEDTPDFYADELKVQFSVKELVDLRERTAKANIPDRDRERALAGIDLEMTEAMQREGLDSPEGAGGKANSATSGNTGGSSSLPS